jgi:hypothetical protein
MTSAQIRDRIASVCAAQPFGFLQAETPFSFDLQPAGGIDQVFRIETEGGPVLGGFNFTEDRTDLMHIWLARRYEGDTNACYRRLHTDASSIRAAVIRDGAVDSGEYFVPDDGAAMVLQREPNRAYAVLKLTLPTNYEAYV